MKKLIFCLLFFIGCANQQLIQSTRLFEIKDMPNVFITTCDVLGLRSGAYRICSSDLETKSESLCYDRGIEVLSTKSSIVDRNIVRYRTIFICKHDN